MGVIDFVTMNDVVSGVYLITTPCVLGGLNIILECDRSKFKAAKTAEAVVLNLE